MDNIFARFVIKSGKLRSAYESNVENAAHTGAAPNYNKFGTEAARRINWAL